MTNAQGPVTFDIEYWALDIPWWVIAGSLVIPYQGERVESDPRSRMFDFAGAAQAIIFVSALAGLAIIGPLWLTYASHCFLVVLTESTVGDDEVRWPDEWLGDW